MTPRVAAAWLEGPPPGWSRLLASDPNAAPAHRPEVWAALAGSLAGLSLRFAAVEEGGELIGGAPAMVERRAGLHWIHGLPRVLPGAPLARAGRHAEVDRAVAGALDGLRRELGAAGGEWSLYRPAGPAVEPAAFEVLPGETRVLESAVIDAGGGLDAAWRRVDRKTRQELGRARARGLRFEEDPGALDVAYALHTAQSRRWRGHRPLPIEVSRRLLRGAAAGGPPAARLFTVRDPRGLLSAALALDHPRETLVWWSGTHPEGRARQAFGLLLWSIVEWAAGEGRERINLGASPGLDPVAAFKRSLGAAAIPYPVRWLDASAAPLAGRLAAAAQRRWRRHRPRGVPA